MSGLWVSGLVGWIDDGVWGCTDMFVGRMDVWTYGRMDVGVGWRR